MKVYIVPERYGSGLYITLNYNNAQIQRDEWAARALGAAAISPSVGSDIDLSDADGVELTIEDARRIYEIKVLDTEAMSDEDRQGFLDQLQESANIFGDAQEIRRIKTSLEN